VPRKCAFCEKQGKLSHEHVLAQWLAREFPKGGRLTTLQEKGPGGVLLREHDAAMLNVQVRHICAKCNSEWMSQIEGDAKPLLLSVMRGKPMQLDPGRQKIIATWAAKTALVFLYAWNTPRPAPVSERRWLFQRHEPPPNVHVWLAAHDREIMAVWSENIRLVDRTPTPREGNAELTTIAINQLVIQILVSRFPVPEGMVSASVVPLTAPANLNYLVELWPTQSVTVSWPPSKVMNFASLDGFRKRFTVTPSALVPRTEAPG